MNDDEIELARAWLEQAERAVGPKPLRVEVSLSLDVRGERFLPYVASSVSVRFGLDRRRGFRVSTVR